jgi:TolB-like protein/Flp pilus assembly protein TadD/class 3 adenylate cyclase
LVGFQETMADVQPEPKLEIAHVLTMDVVEYSTLLITEQTRLMSELTRVVKNTARFKRAEAEGKLIRVPTGDGMLLVFFDDPQAPIQCAMEISAAMKSHPDIRVRMGIHSGPVNEVIDVNDRSNVAGAGVDMAQRVMDCGDRGHILLSKRVADDLAPFPQWNPYLHELGEYEVKHGRKISLVNFYTNELGNPEAPAKGRSAMKDTATAKSTFLAPGPSSSKRTLLVGAAAFVIALAVVAFLFPRTKGFQSWKMAGSLPTANQSIAVLPFENASNDPNADYLSEGISEALINSLTELQQLRVIARSTAFHYKGKDVDPQRVGRELKVAAVLTGRVRQVQDALSVQVDLVDTTTGAQLWGTAYDRKISDVVAVKQAIAQEVAEKLRLKLSGEDQRRLVKRDTTNPEAYQFYLRGRYLWNKRTPDGIKQAIEEFRQAIERDPNFALGYAGLADSYLLLQQYVGVPSSEAMPKARTAVDRALQIDDSLAEAHASSALAHQFMWQWALAEQEFKRAISLNPNYPTAHHWHGVNFYITGHLDDAEKEIKRAQELDPLSPIISANLAIISLLRNDTNAAIEQCQKIIELDSNHISGHDWLGWAYVKQRRYPEAIAEREKVVELSQRSGPQLSGLGYVYALAGRRDEALAILKELEERYARREAVGQHLAAVYYGLGDKDQAFAWLEKDFQEHSAELQHIMERVQFEQLRREPRGVDLIRRMGLSP